MKKLLALCLIASCAVGASISIPASRADDNPDSTQQSEKKKPKHVPFRGKIGTLDKSAGTFKVGERTFHVMPDTKITKATKPASLEDATVGEEVSGAYQKSDDGRLEITTMRIGPKPAKDEPQEEK